jgi:hypothetical protein
MLLIFRMHLQKLNRELEEREQVDGKPQGFRYLL